MTPREWCGLWLLYLRYLATIAAVILIVPAALAYGAARLFGWAR